MRNKNRKVRPGFLHRHAILMFGPAWLVMMADMDVSSYIGAAQTGATFGYGFIWIMLVLIVPLYIVQELAGRISETMSANIRTADIISRGFSAFE